jgi:RimJ/RimL family protein N-acetyltransferase
MTAPVLRTDRLSLVPLRPDDAAEMEGVLGDPALHAFTGGDPLDAASLRERFERLGAGRSADGREAWHNWIVRLLATGEAVGTVQATLVADRSTAEIAWVIGVPWQGRGYASEAARAVVTWLDGIGLATIDAHVHPEHAASEKVAARAGLSLTDELVEGERVWRRATASLRAGPPDTPSAGDPRRWSAPSRRCG